MAKVFVDGSQLRVQLQGWHKLWALKSEITVPLAHVERAEYDPEIQLRPTGLKLPGTFIPGLLTAGSYRGSEGWEFWDVRHAKRAIIIHLRSENYRRLVVEVEQPESTVLLINETVDGR